MVLRCHGDAKDKPVNCKEICREECESLLTETPDMLTSVTRNVIVNLFNASTIACRFTKAGGSENARNGNNTMVSRKIITNSN